MIARSGFLVGLAVCGLAGAAQAQSPSAHAESREYNTALGVECSHCHAATDARDASKPTFDFARRMARMVRGLNDGPLRARGGVTCWSCHRGRMTPARLPRADWESIASTHRATFAGEPDGRGLTMSVYAASLGVACSHCHVDGNWGDASKPAHETVGVMSTIFDVIPMFFDPAVRTPRTQCFMCHHGRVNVERTSPR